MLYFLYLCNGPKEICPISRYYKDNEWLSSVEEKNHPYLNMTNKKYFPWRYLKESFSKNCSYTKISSKVVKEWQICKNSHASKHSAFLSCASFIFSPSCLWISEKGILILSHYAPATIFWQLVFLSFLCLYPKTNTLWEQMAHNIVSWTHLL